MTGEIDRRLLDAFAAATDDIGVALGALGDAYEQLDEVSADALEEALFAPVQAAYGRAQRAHGEFADRHRLPRHAFTPPAPGAPSRGVRGFVEQAVDAVGRADGALADLQDTMATVEAGDPQLGAAIAEVRRHLGDVPSSARQFVRRLGR